MASGESSASEDFTGSENSAASLSQQAHARSRRAAHRIHPYTGRPAARRSLQEVLSPDDIQLAQDSPQFASPTPNVTGGGPTSMNPCPAIDHGLSPTQHIADSHQALLNSEKTPPIRRPPRLARLASAGADADTPDAVLTARVGPVGCRSPRLVERRAHAGSRNSGGENATSNAFLYRLIVKPIVKQARYTKQLWEKFRENMKGRAVKANGDNWSILELDINDRTKMMQFKYKRHLIDSDKTEQQWNSWLISLEKEAVVVRVLLYIYEYVSTIATLQALVSFKKACIDPVATDRAGAASESPLQEIADQLQQRWSSTFQGAAILWRIDRAASAWIRCKIAPPS
ncbi:hypothetical protein ON010_g12656 [Phytophthora cinnamomi]|nr:hypothetical protein ON010_g12656 [Phytophthora cinnamomi]